MMNLPFGFVSETLIIIILNPEERGFKSKDLLTDLFLAGCK